jgi:Protein of unknown function (DUF3396)
MDEPIDVMKLLRETPEKIGFRGGMLTKKGTQDYVGSIPAITGTLFFNDAHTPEVRNAITECFEEYEAIAKSHLTWLWREEPPEGPARIAYKKARSMRVMMGRMDPDDAVSFYYISGKEAKEAGDWEFQVNGLRAWQTKMATKRLCSLRFAVPLLYVIDHPRAVQTMFVSFAKRLHAVHGYGGLSLVLSVQLNDENEPFQAYMAEQINGLDVGYPLRVRKEVVKGIKTVSWLTAINHEMVEKVGGVETIRAALPADWFALYDYGGGIVIQAGPRASAAIVKVDPKPALYVLPNMLLKPVRAPVIGSLHIMSKDGEPRITGQAAENWLQRFDVPENELPAYREKLSAVPPLTEATTLPHRL